MALIKQSASGATFSSLLAPFTSVATATVRPLKAITALELSTLREGDTVYVVSLRDYFKWLPLSAIADDGAAVTIVAPTVVGAGLGRFERLFFYSPDWMIQNTWVIDEANSSTTANNENDGLTAATPLLNSIERRRRMGPQALWLGQAYHLRYISAVATTSDILEGQCLLNAVIYLHASMTDRAGDLLFTGTATTVDTFATATNTPWAITSASIPVSWSTAGPAGTSLINSRLRLTSGANINAISWPTLDQGGAAPNAKARLSEFLIPVASFSVAPFVAPASTRGGPSNGNTFVVEALRVLTRVQINLQGSPGNSNTSTRVIFDSISTTVIGTSACAVYNDGSIISTGSNTALGLLTTHNCRIGSLSDDGLKSILGGMSLTVSLVIISNFGSVSTLDFWTSQGVKQVLLGGAGINGSPNTWLVNNFGSFDNTVEPIVLTGLGVRFGPSTVLYGSGNTAPIIDVMQGVVGILSASTFTQPIVTASAAHVRLNSNPTRTSCPAFDQATSLFTAPRVLSFANIQATVAAGGFDYSFTDPVTGAGFVKY